MKKTVLFFRTIVISDVHLGMRNSKVEQVNKFVKHTNCRTLILNGDIIDAWSLSRRRGTWNKHCTRFIRLILKKIEKKKTKVIYLRGNHDDVLRRFMPIHFEGFNILEEYTLHIKGQKYLVLHGDVFDRITSKYAVIAHLGDIGYQLLLGINRLYNRYRSWKGKRYFSLSKLVKRKVKKAVNFIGKFESSLVGLAKHHGCSGVICGHIHTSEDKMLDDIHYLNSGDWVESLTAIVEHKDGRLELIDYPTFEKLLAEAEMAKKVESDHPGEQLPELEEMPLPNRLLTT
ncbi:MAG: UDP-2,3-diacylglucosamine diphosphatase [Opitutae bacterium]|nr:UDP-2,3-diacylglucosamine diphosphatase [Opitutae bacterium]